MKDKEVEKNEQVVEESQSPAPAGQGKALPRATAAISAIAVAGLALPAVAAEAPAAAVEQKTQESAEEAQTPEISESALDQLLKSADLKIGKSVRVIKALEIQPGAVIAKQYDR